MTTEPSDVAVKQEAAATKYAADMTGISRPTYQTDPEDGIRWKEYHDTFLHGADWGLAAAEQAQAETYERATAALLERNAGEVQRALTEAHDAGWQAAEEHWEVNGIANIQQAVAAERARIVAWLRKVDVPRKMKHYGDADVDVLLAWLADRLAEEA